jgi:hypothetical protein
MTQIVVMPGGFHPFHAGHMALYNSAREAFPDAEVYVAATNDTSSRPFPFAVKEKLAKLAGVEPGHFVQVKSPFRAEEITAKFDPAQDTLIFVRSEKDAGSPPRPGGTKKDGSPAYLQPLAGAENLEPFAQHAYMAYLPTVEFGPGMTSATQIRTAWPGLNDKRKTALVMSLYPKTQTNPKLAATVAKLLDAAIGTQEVTEGNDDVWGPQGRFAGDVPVNLGSGVSTRLDVDDTVTYFGEKATILAMSKDRTVSRIHLKSGITQNVKTSDLKRVGQDVAEGSSGVSVRQWANQVRREHGLDVKFRNRQEGGGAVDSVIARNSSGETVGVYNRKTGFPTVYEPKQGVDENQGWAATYETNTQNFVGGMKAGYQARENQPVDEDYIEEKWSQKYKSSINCANPKGFSQRAHCAGRKK